MEDNLNENLDANLDAASEATAADETSNADVAAEAEAAPSAKVVHTDADSKNGQSKCPRCGSTDISSNSKNGKLRCNFCRHEFALEKVKGLEDDISQLSGETIASGAQDIDENADGVITLKCTSCGAEVVIDTAETAQARCHWCRNTLSVNQQIPNGAIPDVVLPFNLTKEEAQAKIKHFVSKRRFFAKGKFKKEFTIDNVMGVYLPYMIVDVNGHASFHGEGEHLVRSYTVKRKDSSETRYDADLYEIGRDFDIAVEGLTVESSQDKLDSDASTKTNNIINSIMPFDTENCVKFDANYMRGFSSEKRDTNIDFLKPRVEVQTRDIVRHAANGSLTEYGRGVRWDEEDFETKGQQWKAAYLPVWIYSYYQKKRKKSLLHYVAVNARTQETMGSIPISIVKLFFASIVVEILAFFGILNIDIDGFQWFLTLSGPAFFALTYGRYRNTDARHYHEKETIFKISNLKTFDKFIKRLTGLSNSTMRGANNRRVEGSFGAKFDKKKKKRFKKPKWIC